MLHPELITEVSIQWVMSKTASDMTELASDTFSHFPRCYDQSISVILLTPSPWLVMTSSAVSLLWFYFNCIPLDIKQRVVQTSTVYMDQTAKTITNLWLQVRDCRIPPDVKFYTGRQRWSDLSELWFVAEHLLPNAVGRVDDVLTGGILLGLKWHRTVSVPRQIKRGSEKCYIGACRSKFNQA